MIAQRLSEFFLLSEFGQRARHGLAAVSYPDNWIESRLKPLVEALDIIRIELGKPVTILSGYRPPAYNKLIGGAKSSQHMAGRAADIQVKDTSPYLVHAKILKLFHDERIIIGGLGLYPGFVHVDVRPPVGSSHEAAQPGQRLARWNGSRTDS